MNNENWDINYRIGRTMRSFRVQKYKNIERFAPKTGRKPSFLQKVERGDAKPPMDLIHKYAVVLGVNMWEIVKEAEGV